MDRDTLYIFGHKNPDTDSVCSAIAYAELKKRLGLKAEACRLGDLNDETKFVLDYGIELVESEVFPFERTVPAEMVEKIDKYLAKKELAEAAKK